MSFFKTKQAAIFLLMAFLLVVALLWRANSSDGVDEYTAKTGQNSQSISGSKSKNELKKPADAVTRALADEACSCCEDELGDPMLVLEAKPTTESDGDSLLHQFASFQADEETFLSLKDDLVEYYENANLFEAVTALEELNPLSKDLLGAVAIELAVKELQKVPVETILSGIQTLESRELKEGMLSGVSANIELRQVESFLVTAQTMELDRSFKNRLLTSSFESWFAEQPEEALAFAKTKLSAEISDKVISQFALNEADNNLAYALQLARQISDEQLQSDVLMDIDELNF